MVDYVEAEQAMAVVAKLGFHVRDQGLLLSTLARPSAGMLGEGAYPSIEQEAAALLSSLSQNHALFDDNKRLSLLLTFIFLELNGFTLTFTNDEAFDLVLAAAQSRMTVDELAAVIAAGIRRQR